MTESIRDQYEHETGKKYRNAEEYLCWLERRAACAEELVVVLKLYSKGSGQADDPIKHEYHFTAAEMKQIRAAFAAYEAACKGEKHLLAAQQALESTEKQP